jgi:NTP pyrophosphatase (non-canonical NTP hydrolase)
MQCEEPSPEQIQIIQERLIAEMEELFDKYKHLYGWEDKRLVVK